MKYWRGYLVAAILGALSWGLLAMAEKFTVLVDMVYPYVTRTVQGFLAVWSSGTELLLWQVGAVVLVLALMTSLVLLILLRWNPIQWGGWVLAVIAGIYLLHTCVYGLNYHSGPIATDVRLEVTEYTLKELEKTTIYYRDKANDLAAKMPRDEDGNLDFEAFDVLAQKASQGFEVLTYQDSYPVFAGDKTPVKKLGWVDLYSSKGITGITFPITGEAAVNPEAPAVVLPFAMCTQMAKRMCIAVEHDANFAAFLACSANSDPQFQYSAYCMAYRYCHTALSLVGSPQAAAAAVRIQSGVSSELGQDLTVLSQFLPEEWELTATKLDGSQSSEEGQLCDLLVSWHIQQVVLPAQREEAVSTFDPYDKTQVDLSGIVGALPKEEEEADVSDAD